MSVLFSPFRLRGVEFKNRIFVSPMCQYSCVDGVPNDWHLVHLGSRAVGGAALVMAEATAVSPEGRISPSDAGIWNERQAREFGVIARFIKEQGAIPAIQLAHAGRKASTSAPWEGGRPLPPGRAWTTYAPSDIAFGNNPTPREMTHDDLRNVLTAFREAARRAWHAGFEVVEVHMAHGYLLHEFLSPLSNQRSDGYGKLLSGRISFPLDVARAVREVWPATKPMFVRISASDWVDGGWDLPQSVELARRLKEIGADLIDCSSGGLVPDAKVPMSPGYQVPFAEAIRKEADIATGAVGLITKPQQAEEIVANGRADAVFLAREMLRDPYWPLHAARALRAKVDWPKQYQRAKPADDE